MTRLARAAAVAVAFLALTGCIEMGDWGDNERFKEDFHKTFPLDSGGAVTVDNYNGSIEILGWDQNSVEVTGTKYAATKDLLDQLKIEMEGEPRAVRIRSIRPPSSH